ncbi:MULTISPECIES: hypothetical protein [Staphylococcus]|uniref:hypothetical protein n=1 Tax=Staphylococcus TaxID=1279 RepID=UPI00164DA873|nr:hypothetical protein [Staphylococcus nepalensis]
MKNQNLTVEQIDEMDFDAYEKIWSIGDKTGKSRKPVKRIKAGQNSPEELMRMF